VVPAMPAFYHLPESIGDLVDFVAGRILDAAGVEATLYQRWGE
jgi:flavin prenyltransferase